MTKLAGWFGLKKPRAPSSDPRERHWHEWRANPSAANLEALLKAYEPEMKWRVRELSTGFVPPTAMMRFAKSKALRAFDTWDPSKEGGAALKTWVSTHVQQIGSDMNRYQFETQLRGKRPELVRRISDAQDTLTQELGRPPTLEELHVDTGEDPNEIARLLGELQGVRSGSTLEPDPFHTQRLAPDQVHALRLVRMDLTPTERLVWDLTHGMNGQPKLRTQTEIARRVGVSDATVTRALRKIEKMVAEYGEDL